MIAVDVTCHTLMMIAVVAMQIYQDSTGGISWLLNQVRPSRTIGRAVEGMPFRGGQLANRVDGGKQDTTCNHNCSDSRPVHHVFLPI